MDTKKIVGIAWFSAIGVVAVWALTFFLLLIPDAERQGQFGDMFGAVNALFSGLAFAGLIITLILQRRELSLQRDELEQTRKEFSEQNKTMKRQRFENTFFNLMSLLQHITDNLECTIQGQDSYSEVKGREVFKMLYRENVNYDGSRGIKGFLKENSVDQLFQYQKIDVLNHYFHFFDGIIDYIDGSDLLEEKERSQYAVMLRNSLSDDERYVLFYYYALFGGWRKLMAEKYALFYAIVPNLLAKSEHYELFEHSAYNHDFAIRY